MKTLIASTERTDSPKNMDQYQELMSSLHLCQGTYACISCIFREGNQTSQDTAALSYMRFPWIESDTILP